MKVVLVVSKIKCVNTSRITRLGDPVVVALAGETNRVPLLMGVEYAVTSSVPLDVWAEDGHATIVTNNDRNYTVSWPLSFGVAASQGGGYSIDVQPFDPGGEFSWARRRVEDNAPYQTARVLARRDGDTVGCAYTSASNWVGFTCGSLGDCGCHGCSVDGIYVLEDAVFAATRVFCGCAVEANIVTQEIASLSVSFDRPAVIFERQYENAPGEWIAGRSTEVSLRICASGGTNGATVALSYSNIGKLLPKDGPIALPPSVTLPPRATYFASFTFTGKDESGSEDDICAEGTLVDDETGERIESGDIMTAVRVELRPHVTAPLNDKINRHTYGVCELVQHLQFPSTPEIMWNSIGGGSNEVVNGTAYYRCPLYGCANILQAEIGAARHLFEVAVIEPDGMESKAVEAIVYSNAVHTGEAGGIGMRLHLYVTPLDVSFSEIAVQEVPCFTYTVTGYFENPYFNGAFAHTGGWWGAGAGRWTDVELHGNRLYLYDTAAYETKIPWLTPSGMFTTNFAYAWTEGHAYMDTPLGWNVRGTSGDAPPYKQFGGNLQQVFRIDRHGRVGVFKLDNWVTRTTNDVVTLMGPRTEKLY